MRGEGGELSGRDNFLPTSNSYRTGTIPGPVHSTLYSARRYSTPAVHSSNSADVPLPVLHVYTKRFITAHRRRPHSRHQSESPGSTSRLPTRDRPNVGTVSQSTVWLTGCGPCGHRDRLPAPVTGAQVPVWWSGFGAAVHLHGPARAPQQNGSRARRVVVGWMGMGLCMLSLNGSYMMSTDRVLP